VQRNTAENNKFIAHCKTNQKTSNIGSQKLRQL